MKPAVIGTNLMLALITLIVMLMTAAIFNQTLEENDRELRTALHWLAAPFRAINGLFGGIGATIGSSWMRTAIGPLVALGLAALLFAFEDPTFGFNDETVVLTLSFLAAFVALTYVYEGGQLLMTNRYGVPAAIQIFPTGVIIAIVFVLVSRIQGFQPGLVFGFIAAHTLTAPAVMTREQQGKQVLWPALAMLSVCVIAWLLASPARDLAQDGDSMWAALPEGIAVGVFVAGIESLFLTMIPIKFMDGHKLISWSKPAWAAIALSSGFLFWHAMMNEERDSLDALGQTGASTALTLMAVALAISLGTYLFFRVRNNGRAHA